MDETYLSSTGLDNFEMTKPQKPTTRMGATRGAKGSATEPYTRGSSILEALRKGNGVIPALEPANTIPYSTSRRARNTFTLLTSPRRTEPAATPRSKTGRHQSDESRAIDALLGIHKNQPQQLLAPSKPVVGSQWAPGERLFLDIKAQKEYEELKDAVLCYKPSAMAESTAICIAPDPCTEYQPPPRAKQTKPSTDRRNECDSTKVSTAAICFPKSARENIKFGALTANTHRYPTKARSDAMKEAAAAQHKRTHIHSASRVGKGVNFRSGRGKYTALPSSPRGGSASGRPAVVSDSCTMNTYALSRHLSKGEEVTTAIEPYPPPRPIKAAFLAHYPLENATLFFGDKNPYPAFAGAPSYAVEEATKVIPVKPSSLNRHLEPPSYRPVLDAEPRAPEAMSPTSVGQ